MHPGMFGWWKHARAHGGCGEGHEGRQAAWAGGGGCGPGGHGGTAHGHGGPWRFAGPGHHGGGDDGEYGGGAFGVRRPLRFLAFKLELSEEQVAELARVLDDLKTERAQASVDNRRTTAAFADALAGETFDAEKVSAAAGIRVKSAERLKDAVATALGRIHAILDPQQRAKLAYLIRTGALTI